MIRDCTEGKTTIKAVISRLDTGKNSKGSPYLSLLLADRSGQLDAKYWHPTPEQLEALQAGQVVLAKGEIILYRDTHQMRINRIEVLPDQKPSDYWPSVPTPKEEMKQAIEKLIEQMHHHSLKQVLKALFDQYMEDYVTYPAATRNHHNIVGGLAYHSLAMVKAAQALLPLYPQLNEDLLIAGILCHDFGKIWELSDAIMPSYTVQGNLLGHISMMQAEIARIAHDLHCEDEMILLLRHMVLSHHGKLEFGSPVLPLIPEAEVLTMLDNLDARMNMMERHLSTTAEGGFSLRDYALDNRMIYKRRQS